MGSRRSVTVIKKSVPTLLHLAFDRKAKPTLTVFVGPIDRSRSARRHFCDKGDGIAMHVTRIRENSRRSLSVNCKRPECEYAVIVLAEKRYLSIDTARAHVPASVQAHEACAESRELTRAIAGASIRHPGPLGDPTSQKRSERTHRSARLFPTGHFMLPICWRTFARQESEGNGPSMPERSHCNAWRGRSTTAVGGDPAEQMRDHQNRSLTCCEAGENYPDNNACKEDQGPPEVEAAVGPAPRHRGRLQPIRSYVRSPDDKHHCPASATVRQVEVFHQRRNSGSSQPKETREDETEFRSAIGREACEGDPPTDAAEVFLQRRRSGSSLPGYAARRRSPSCAGGRGLPKASTTAGRRSSWKLASAALRATQRARRHLAK